MPDEPRRRQRSQDPIIAVVHLDKRAAPKESCAPCGVVVIEFVSLPRDCRRMFTSCRDFRRLSRYLLIYRARHVIYGRENVRLSIYIYVHLYVCVLSLSLSAYTRIRNPKLQETRRLRLSKSRVKDIFYGMKDEKGMKRMRELSHKFGRARRFFPRCTVSKLYSNLCGEAVDILQLGIENGESVKCKARIKKHAWIETKALNYD